MHLPLRKFIFGLLLMLAPSVWADTGTATTTLTIDPSATAGSTITAADENDRNNDTSAMVNAHVHSLSNTTNLGDAAAGNKNLCFDAADSTDMCIRFDDTANLITINSPATGSYNQVATLSGTSGVTGLLRGDGIGAILGNSTVALTTDTTGNYAAGDAEAGAALSIVSGAAPTVDAAGEAAVDTTDDQWIYYGGAKRVLPYERTVGVVIESLTDADDNFAFYMANDAITVTGVGCNCRGTCSTLATFTLEDRGANAMTITGTNPTCATTGAATFAAVTAGNSLTAGEMVAFDVTNTPTTGDTYGLYITLTQDAQ